jgi:hypothetical protein
VIDAAEGELKDGPAAMLLAFTADAAVQVLPGFGPGIGFALLSLS